MVLLHPLTQSSSGPKSITVRRFDAGFFDRTCLVRLSGRPPSHLADQFIFHGKVTRPPDKPTAPVY